MEVGSLKWRVATYVNLYSYKFVTKLITESPYNSSALDNHLARHNTGTVSAIVLIAYI